MRYIAIHTNGAGGLDDDKTIYTIENDTGHGYLVDVKTNKISYREAVLKPSGAYYGDNTYIIPETDPWFNYFVFERAILSSPNKIDVTDTKYYVIYYAFKSHVAKLAE